ncbi:5-oxoprolinase subunit PxpB [Marinobacter zhejiangensis]|uniref:Sensor histidine kinase inhibitor, KipI family n=1 Tax=Marinobacter zhejiangensis TaxID=488535 RepID=A0A1I4RW90_9GAMM|nr:5-oxoprolinase subunit PxpB [Marinobacter zhejiangensis]SFM56461.1 sensor histidine kinase inhibitor, KipI family [Marinobacter zhejiangensis]
MIDCVSENSVLVTLGNRIDPALTSKIVALCEWLDLNGEGWLVDLVPSYTTLLVVYDPLQRDFRDVTRIVRQGVGGLAQLTRQPSSEGHSHEIPVYYSPESGPDLLALAKLKGLSVDEVIRLHSQRSYQVYALGFLPGFGFLGTVDPQIQAPRKVVPRASVPAGSVAIANGQTAIYPRTSPGGWQLIGRSPTVMFDRHSLSRLSIGDQVRFFPVSRKEYLSMGGEL